MKYKIKKPKGTFYCDYTIQDGKCYAIFEHADRVTNRFVCNTNKTNSDWMTFDIRETECFLIINLNEKTKCQKIQKKFAKKG